MSRFTTVPFDIQCLTISHLTDWSNIRKVISLYIDNNQKRREFLRYSSIRRYFFLFYQQGIPDIYQKVLDCIREILQPKAINLADLLAIEFDDLTLLTNIEIVNHRVIYDINQRLSPISDLSNLKYLRQLTVEFGSIYILDKNGAFQNNFEFAANDNEVIQLISVFFSNSDLRQQQGHLIYYIKKQDIYNLIYLGDTRDLDCIYTRLHQLGEIDVRTGNYKGLINRYWGEFLNRILPSFTIQQLTFANLPRPPLKYQINGLVTRSSNLHRMFRYNLQVSQERAKQMENYLSNLEYILYPPINSLASSHLDIKRVVVQPQSLSLDGMMASEWIGYTNWLGYIITKFPNVDEVLMLNCPRILGLNGESFITNAVLTSKLVSKYLISSNSSSDQQISLRIFIIRDYLDDLIRNFPNCTETYYVVNHNFDLTVEDVDRLLSNLDKLRCLVVFTSRREIAISLGKYYLDSNVIDIRLV